VQLDVRRLDVTEFDSLPRFVEGVVRDHGRIDVLINNAGIAVGGFGEDVTLQELRLQLETNFFAQVALTRAVIPVMRKQTSGHIIMVSSIGGLRSAPAIGSYNASKFALEGWSEALRLELNALGIKVVLVEPGSFQTGIWNSAVLAQKFVDGTSPNHELGVRLRKRVQQLPKGDPIEVARVIARVAQDPNPRLRYIVGGRAHLELWLKRILPWKWHERLVGRVLGE
jgi:NAD(P)-dependent dehydrogenase (short-subunit alcohol dehydrogenase family)